MKIITWLIRCILTCAIIVMLITAFLLTPYALNVTLYALKTLNPGTLNYTQAEGLLIGPIHITDVDYRHNNTHLYIKDLTLNWNLLDLFQKKLTITQLTVHELTFQAQTQAHNKFSLSEQNRLLDFIPTTLKPLHIPLSLHVMRLHFDHVSYQNNQTKFYINTLDSSGTIEPNHINFSIITQLKKPRSVTARIFLQGSLKHYKIVTTLRVQKKPITISGVGTTDQMTFLIPNTAILTGNLKALLNISWYPHIEWNINVLAKKIDLSLISQHLATAMDASLQSTGMLRQRTPIGNFTLSIHSAQSKIYLALNHQQQWQANWAIHIMDLSQWLTQGHGAITTQGTLTGDLRHPETTGSLSANDIALAQVSASTAQINWRLFFDNDLPSSLQLTLNQLVYKSKKINTLQVSATGQLKKPLIYTTLRMNQNQLLMQTKIQKEQAAWSGLIMQFTLHDDVLGNWALHSASHFLYSPQQLYLTPTCLNTSSGATLCTAFKKNKNNQWNASADGKHITLNNTVSSTSHFQFNGKLGFHIDANGQGNTVRQASAHFASTPGKITYSIENQFESQSIQKLEITAEIHPNQELHAALAVLLNKTDSLKSELNIPHFSDFSMPLTQKTLSASVAILIHKLQSPFLIESLLKVSLDQLAGHFRLHGTLEKPNLSGSATLKANEFEYLTAQMHAHNITGTIQAKNNTLLYHVVGHTFNNAPAVLTGNTTITPKSVATHLLLTTKYAEVARNNQFNLFATSTVNFFFTAEELNIQGKILLDKALLQPTDFQDTLLLPKEYVTYLGLPNDVIQNKYNKKTLNLTITLGHDVRLNAYGIQGKLLGTLALSMTPKQTTLANGRIRIVDGTFKAYGKYLKLTPQSEMSFIQSPMTDPTINARAFKYINANISTLGSEDFMNQVLVGIYIHGPLSNLQLDLYSEPANINQADILSYLVLGYASNDASNTNISTLFSAATTLTNATSGFDQPTGFIGEIKQALDIQDGDIGVRNEAVVDAIGNTIQTQSSFVVGHRLTKHIYIEYSRGTLISGNTVQVSYRINNHWRIQTSAGSSTTTLGSATGADILYSFSRN